MKNALITGISGQDGAYLASFLLEKGFKVIGTSRFPDDTQNLWRLKKLNIYEDTKIISTELNFSEIIDKYSISEIYNLAGQSSVADSFKAPFETISSNGMLTLRLLEAVRKAGRDVKFYNASSSEIFGNIKEFSKDELSNYHPRSPYAVAKILSHFCTINYREAYDLYACNGILFNHESILRGESFVTQKITRAVAEISFGKREKLLIGNLSARRDWGHALDFVSGIYKIMHHSTPDDYVLSTGRLSSVRDFIHIAFSVVGIKMHWEGKGLDEKGICIKTGRKLVSVDGKLFRPTDIAQSLGNSLKAQNILGWKPEISLESLISEMVQHQLSKLHIN